MKKIILIGLVLMTVLPANGATRLYLPSSGPAPVNFAFPFDATIWTGGTASADRIRCVTSIHKNQTATTDKAGLAVTTATLNRQYISDPIATQTISGVVQGQIAGWRSAGNKTAASDIRIVVVSSDATTVRGTLLAITQGTNYGTVQDTNHNTPAISAVTSVNAQNGDRIVIEVGGIKTGSGGSATITQNFGDNGTQDFTGTNEAETNAYNPWVEFSADITIFHPNGSFSE